MNNYKIKSKRRASAPYSLGSYTHMYGMESINRKFGYVEMKQKKCKLCGNTVPPFTKTMRVNKSNFCRKGCQRIWKTDSQRTKPKVWRGVRQKRAT